VKLGEIDSKQLTSTKYQAKWDGYHTRYKDALRLSRKAANDIADNALEFNAHYLPYTCGVKYPDHSKEKRIRDLAHFVDDLKDSKKEADTVQKQFSDLSRDITDFKNSFVQFAEEEIKKTKGEVSQLRIDIAALKTKVSELTTKLVLLLGAVALVALAGLALAIIFPAFAGAIGTATLLAVGAVGKMAYDTMKEKNEASENLSKKEAELKEKTKTLDALQNAHDDLKKLGETEITKVIAGVNMLSDIWARASEDCDQIEKYLKKTQRKYDEFATDPDAPAVIISYLKSGGSIYAGLGQALKTYVIGAQKAL